MDFFRIFIDVKTGVRQQDNMRIPLSGQGERAAFERLFREHYAALCNYAHTFLGDAAQAEDVVQDVFIRLWRERARIEVHTSQRSYLYASVRNKSLNILKHRAVEQHHNPRLAAFFDELAREEYSEEEDKCLMRIREAILALPPQCHAVFIMVALDGRKYREVAQGMGISINTVRSHMMKAYRLVREYAQLREERAHSLSLIGALLCMMSGVSE